MRYGAGFVRWTESAIKVQIEKLENHKKLWSTPSTEPIVCSKREESTRFDQLQKVYKE